MQRQWHGLKKAMPSIISSKFSPREEWFFWTTFLFRLFVPTVEAVEVLAWSPDGSLLAFAPAGDETPS